MYFYKSSATDPTGATAAGGNVNISNLNLYLALESNPAIEGMIMAKCQTADGLQVLTDCVYPNRINLAGTYHSITQRYDRSFGSKLKKIYYAPYNNTETANTMYDHDNKAGSKITNFITKVNGNRTQEFDLYTTNYDDYFIKKDSVRGSCLLSLDEYYYNWAYVEDFTDGNPVWKSLSVPDDSCMDGLDLTNQVKYEISAYNSAGAVTLNHYSFAVTQKLLVVNQSGITLL